MCGSTCVDALADLAIVLHFGFILFVVFGALLVCRWAWTAWVHIPALIWGAMIEFMGFICPLTELENTLRARGSGGGYSGSFIEQYIVPVIYPTALTRGTQIALGIALIVFNGMLYALVIYRRMRREG